MVFSPKEIYKLRTGLSHLVDNGDDIKKYWDYAGLGNENMNFGRDAWTIWKDIFDLINLDKEKVLKLLRAVLRDFEENKLLNDFITEVTSGKELKIETIANAFRSGQCVVFLGPEVLRVRENDKQPSFNNWLSDKLKEEMKDGKVYFNSKFGNHLSYVSQCYINRPMYQTIDLSGRMQKSYRNFVEEGNIDLGIYTELAKLPLTLVVNANIDDQLFHLMKAEPSRRCSLEWYDISNGEAVGKAFGIPKEQILEQGSTPETLIYNIFGYYDSASSILHTEAQFLDFINRVTMGNPKLDAKVMERIIDKECYLFLGFDFEQWYFKVLFHLFKLKNESISSVSCSFDEYIPDNDTVINEKMFSKISARTREFFEDEFKMFFVNEDVRSFVKKIVKKVQA